MSIASIPVFSLQSREGPRLSLKSTQGHTADIFVLEEHIVRVMLLPFRELRQPKTWAIAPGLDDVPQTGRDRFDVTGFALPTFTFDESCNQLRITTRFIRLTIALAGFVCHWEARSDDQWHLVAEDRPTQAYNFGLWGDRVYHYLARFPDESYFGLGERSGNTNRAGSRYRMTNVDAMGYDARSTDPLYKHIPFYITRRSTSRISFGLFYDTVADCIFDLGRELDNYHGPFRYFRADAGDLDYYFIAGPQPLAIVRRYTWLTGRPSFTPKWSLGYSGSTMTYTDAPDAQIRMKEFLENCREHDIPCDSFHLSSGYTSIGNRRYVFTWNNEKFPDPDEFVRNYLHHGVRLCANIKPCLLRDHPHFADAAANGLFIRDKDGRPEMVQFWGETGAYLDFTNPAAAAWWKGRITESLLRRGIKATWNDNNEFELWNPDARAHGFGREFGAAQAKPLQTLLMMRASFEAQTDYAPRYRPFVVSRSGAAGMQRYAQTWSGDNYTSWDTLRFNIKMGIGLALSGISNIGHDVGGFAGPAPDPELFLRWIQFGIFMPRFSIHSWNDDGSVNEPWMYPDLTPVVKALFDFRYRLLPHLYNLLWRYHRDYDPIIRPTFLGFPRDQHCYIENDDMMLGEDLLVAAVVEPGATSRVVHLPSGAGWYDYWRGTYYDGGRDITLAAPVNSTPPLLAREGCAIALNLAQQHFGQSADERGFQIFPHRSSGRSVYECFEDDGESTGYREGRYWTWRLSVTSEPDQVSVRLDRTSKEISGPNETRLLFPRHERRAIHLSSGAIISDSVNATHREIRVALRSPASS
ncbi:MAG: glycoside hydrolase family 31 protein [Candidatus Binataceae bacterium]